MVTGRSDSDNFSSSSRDDRSRKSEDTKKSKIKLGDADLFRALYNWSGGRGDGDVLGSGAFAVIKKATAIDSGSIVAVKCINVSGIKNDEERLKKLSMIRFEIKLHMSLRAHPNIVQCKDAFIIREKNNKPQEFRLAMEFVDGTSTLYQP